MQLVELNKKAIYADSNLIARKFGMQHAKVVNAMETLIPKLDDFRVPGFHPKFMQENREYRGSHYTAYLVNRDCFMLLALRFDTKKARQWQGRFLSAFNLMEDSLQQVQTNKSDMEWNEGRLIGKQARLEETDTIKEFIEYAVNQGSTHANFYYTLVTNATYKALGLMAQKHPKLRDQMNIYEISQLMLAEKLAANKIKEYMALERNYKDIYNSVKDDLINFADAVRLN